MEVERYEHSWGVRLSLDNVDGSVTRGLLYGDQETKGTVNWCAIGSVSPAEARAFAQRIIAVADAVEQELAKGEK